MIVAKENSTLATGPTIFILDKYHTRVLVGAWWGEGESGKAYKKCLMQGLIGAIALSFYYHLIQHAFHGPMFGAGVSSGGYITKSSAAK